MLIEAHIEPALEVEPRRREQRHDLLAPIGFRVLGAPGVAAKLVNLSSRGFMARTNSLIERGSRVWVTLPGLSRASATIMWSRGCRVGGHFAEPIDVLKVFEAAGKAAG